MGKPYFLQSNAALIVHFFFFCRFHLVKIFPETPEHINLIKTWQKDPEVKYRRNI